MEQLKNDLSKNIKEFENLLKSQEIFDNLMQIIKKHCKYLEQQ